MSEKQPAVSIRRFLASLALGAAFGLAAAAPAEAQCPTSVNQLRRWECTLTSVNDYLTASNNGNPYRDLELKVTFRNTATNETLTTYGFWDGDTSAANRKTFKIRGAFPAGTWRWSTSCRLRPTPPAHSTAIPDCAGDTGLNKPEIAAQTINVQGVIIGDGNELYNRGFLKRATGTNTRYLTYGDGSPFYWLGDTAWAASMAANTNGDFATYLSDRAFRSQVEPSYPPFTVIHMAPAPLWAGQRTPGGALDLLNGIPLDAQGRRPFEQVGGCTASGPPPNNCSRWVSAYWRDLDQKVQNANVSGLVVLMAGVMNPLGEDGTVVVPPLEEAKIFARNFVGRLFGNFVLFSPGFDARPSNFSAHINGVGCAIEQASCRVGTPATACNNGCKGSLHLITNHPGGGSSLAELQALQSQPWMSFQMFQSGQCLSSCNDADCQRTCATDRARSLPLSLQSGGPKANINGEAIYEGPTTYGGVNYTAYRARQTAYLSTLSGAFGYTFGVCGLFEWGRDPSNICPNTADYLPTNAITRESSKQMRYLANIFEALFWQRLVGNQTEHDRIVNQTAGTPADQKMVLARDGNSAILAYLPKEKSQIELNLSVLTGFPANWTAKWCNPRTGSCSTGATAVPNGGTKYLFNTPACPGACDAADWVLKLVNTMPASPTPLSASARMEAWSEPDEDGSASRILARIEDPAGLARRDDFEVSSRQGFARHPRIGRDGGGLFTVVWQSDMQDGELGGIFARRYDNRGNPLDEEFQVNTTSAGDQFHPSITATPSGDFVVVWSSRGQDGDGSGVFARMYDKKGTPLGDELQVNTTTAGDQGFARVLASPDGDFVVAWESRDALGASAIRVQLFDRKGGRVGPEQPVSSSILDSLSLGGIQMDPSGTLTVHWEQFGEDTVSRGRFARRYDRRGVPSGLEFRVAD